VCAVSEALCLISDGHYTESGNCLISDEENGRCVLWGRVSYVKKREMHVMGARLLSQKKGDTHYGGRVSLLPNSTKNIVNKIFFTGCSLHQHATCPLAHIRARMCANGHPTGPA
jgi:hypothetical protein